MKIWYYALVLTSLASPSLAQTAKQFDLACVGTERIEGYSALSPSPAEPKPLAQTLSVDLTKNVFCYRGCRKQFEISKVTPSELILRDKTNDDGALHTESHTTVDRISGNYKDVYLSQGRFSNVATIDEGKCKIMPFTPMPAAQF